jgi:hypothetical protein
MKLSEQQEELIKQAGKLIKKAFPGENMQFCFNLTTKHDNINFNMDGTWKKSGILKG